MSHLPDSIVALLPEGTAPAFEARMRELEKALTMFGIGVEKFFSQHADAIPAHAHLEIAQYLHFAGRKALREEITRIHGRIVILTKSPKVAYPGKRPLRDKAPAVREAVRRIHDNTTSYQRAVIQCLASTPDASSSHIRESIGLPPGTSRDYKHVTDAFRRRILEPLIKAGMLGLFADDHAPRKAIYRLTPLGVKNGLKFIEGIEAEIPKKPKASGKRPATTKKPDPMTGQAPRKRGRPRKEAAPADLQTQTPRKPGRPRKDASSHVAQASTKRSTPRKMPVLGGAPTPRKAKGKATHNKGRGNLG